MAEAYVPAVTCWHEQLDDGQLNLTALHEWLVTEHAYAGSVRSLWRYFRAHYPRPRIRARRRLETPSGAQAQADRAEFCDVRVGGRLARVNLFALMLSFSRYSLRYSVFSDQYRRWLASQEPVLHQQHAPGEKAFVD